VIGASRLPAGAATGGFVLIPDHETAVDFLNYEAVAKTVVALLNENREHALTIGIHGDWGAGKSSVLKMTQAAMADDKRVACLWFNGWAFQGFDDAKTVLIETIITELCRQRSTSGKVKEYAKDLLKRVDYFKLARRGAGLAFNVLTGMPSPDQITAALGDLQSLAGRISSLPADVVEQKITAAASYLRAAEERSIPEEMHEFHERFKKLLDEAEIDQLVVLIDDLDRCLPETAIDTLEAIRLFLFVPKTAFVIGADEGMIEYAVREHFPNLPLSTGPIPYARNYLEKLIQVPFRIPALGVQESRAYVTLLLVQALVGENAPGFKALLSKARDSLNRPWLGVGISQADVKAVDAAKTKELDAIFVLAQQIGPILAEGTKGNPRQVKRFLNALFIRLAIAKERGFADKMNPAPLGKLMLAERFQQDFYDQVAEKAMLEKDGEVRMLAELESAAREDSSNPAKQKKPANGKSSAADDEVKKWLGREWLTRWLKIEPSLAGVDLRPYVFVARDKRILSFGAAESDLDVLIQTLAASEMAARSVEPQVKAMTPPAAEQVFAALRERVMRHGSFADEPPGFLGLTLVAKHHPRHQSDILSLLGGIDHRQLGMWVTRGWNEIMTDAGAKDQLRALLSQWANQDDNATLKKAAGQALSPTAQRGPR
jgi:predicted KAP-like P-loop ATPase